MVWSAGARPKRRRSLCAVRDRAFLPGPPGFWDTEWFTVPASVICADDIAHWPHTPGILVKWVTFLGTLHWPTGGLDLGVGGISYVELLDLYELFGLVRGCLWRRLTLGIFVCAPNFSVGCSFWSRH